MAQKLQLKRYFYFYREFYSRLCIEPVSQFQGFEINMKSCLFKENTSYKLKAPIQPSYLACVAPWLVFVVTIFMDHENATTKANQEISRAKHHG